MKKIDLSGQWFLKEKGKDEEYPCILPGDNISALFKNGVVEDPYYGMNEKKLQWIGQRDWSFIKEFQVDEDFLDHPNLFLEFESIDTVFEAKLNGVSIGSGSNAFVRQSFEVAGILVKGKNRLVLNIKSPENHAKAQKETLSYPVPHAMFPLQSEGRNLLRKIQCHSGWDWGPCLMVSGVYGEMNLKASSLENIEHLHCDITPQKDSSGHSESLENWIITIHGEIRSPIPGKTRIKAQCAGNAVTKDLSLNKGLQKITLKLPVKRPELWWPSGYGKQVLYELKVITDHDSISKKIGFRKARVITKPDSRGRAMTVRINNKDIFCKGANWIPADALPSAWSRESYINLLESAEAANMNMLRVWGGGQYEKEIFYQLCDEKGIMIWQDFMFSCSTYPGNRDFLAQVKEEAEFQVKRLKDHPSLVLWCGNNEDLGALGWFEESIKNRDRYIVDYDRLNEGVLGTTVKTLDPNRKWWPSSPSAGEGDYSDCWHDDSKGDMHYWSVWHEGKAFEAYRDVVPRFCSEFGFQSFPSMEVIKNFAPCEQHNISSPVMKHHQRNPKGNSIIINTMANYFRFPSSFEETVYISRIQQAVAIKTAVEYWRSQRPQCMGSLYWQLNDTWPVASWASLDYGGGWKPLHYSAKNFFAPLLLTLHETRDYHLEIKLCNDSLKVFTGILELRLYDFQGNIMESITEEITAEAERVSLLKTLKGPLAEVLRQNCFFHGEVWDKTRGIRVTENTLFLEKPKNCEIGKSRINAEFLYREGIPMLELSCGRPCFFTVMELEGWNGRFSENNFTLLPGKTREITLTGPPVDKAYLKKHLRIHSLRNFHPSVEGS